MFIAFCLQSLQARTAERSSHPDPAQAMVLLSNGEWVALVMDSVWVTKGFFQPETNYIIFVITIML